MKKRPGTRDPLEKVRTDCPSGGSTVGTVYAERLRRLRAQKGISREDLSRQLDGVSAQTIARLERGPAVTGTDTLIKLAKYFNVPCGQLLGENAPNLGKYFLNDEISKQITEFLDRLFETGNVTRALQAISMFLRSNRGTRDVEDGMEAEEEVLGLWWSIVSAYRQGEWDMMTRCSQALVDLAEGLGRPYLAAIGHSYRAKAMRNKGGEDAVERAEAELNKALASDGYRSALTLRMRGKMHSRRGELETALASYQQAENLMRQSSRSDAWFLLEKTKLLRNIAAVHGRLAARASAEGKADEKSRHLGDSERHITLCTEAIAVLKHHLPLEAAIEEMLLSLCTAEHLANQGRFREARDEAKGTLDLAEKLQQGDYAVGVKMFLFRVHMEIGEIEEAIHYFGSLLPLETYSTGRFEWRYRRHVMPHEATVFKYLQQQCDARATGGASTR